MFTTYILFSSSANRYYVGSCEDVVLRLERHNRGGVPSTKPFKPWQLVHTESFDTRAEAVNREKEIKSKKSRKFIERLVESADTSRLSGHAVQKIKKGFNKIVEALFLFSCLSIPKHLFQLQLFHSAESC